MTMKYLVTILCLDNNDHEIFGHNFMFGQKCFRFRMLPFFKINFSKNSYSNAINVSNSLDVDQNKCSVSLNLGPNCLQRLSVDDKNYPYKGKIPNIRLKIVQFGRYIVGIMAIFEGSVHVSLFCSKLMSILKDSSSEL